VTGVFVSALILKAEAPETESGFGERIAENQRRVFQIAYSVLGNSADAEDVAQEAFLRAYQKFDSLREAEKFRAWVNRIVFRLALNRRRGHLRRLTRDTAWQITEAPAMIDGARDAEQRVMLERMRKQIELLPDKFRSVLQLSLVEEMEAADVGAILGIPAGTVRSRVHTARKLLLEAMK
jgi:RNA polymerase sigma-70 factor (ECF subfamily)